MMCWLANYRGEVPSSEEISLVDSLYELMCWLANYRGEVPSSEEISLVDSLL
jgi:hypothetical protein